MPVVGIIAEYNPFHNGHAYHLNASREAAGADRVVVVMSGCFVQRGEPSVCDKWARTEMALRNGADLVIELPVYYATASAEYFAWAAVKLLDSLGTVTHIGFGAESGDLDALKVISAAIAKAENSADYQEAFHRQLDLGLPYFTAREKALSLILRIDSNFIRKPNHILAIEYLKTLDRLHSPMIPIAVRRNTAALSSSEIRRTLAERGVASVRAAMPDSAWELLVESVELNGTINLDNYSNIVQYLLKTASLSELKGIMDMNEGLENRLIRCTGENTDVKAILDAAKTKRYPYTKLQRVITHLLLKLRRDEFMAFNEMGGPQYIRIMGFRKSAADLFGKAELPIIIGLKQAEMILSESAQRMLQADIRCADIYHLNHGPKNNEHHVPIVIID